MWSWDITKLHGPAKWTYYYLYVILDIYSRYVVGWMVATRESAALAEVLIRQTCAKQGIGARPADHPRRPRLLDDLQAGGVPARRPRRHPVPQPPARLRRQPVLSEAQFKTLKYRPDFPGRFASIEAARAALPARSSPGTTTNIATAGWACTPPPTSTTAPPRPSGDKRAGVLDRRLRRPPRTVRPQAARAAEAAHRLLDQPTRRDRGGHSVISARRCLIQVDRFRPTRPLTHRGAIKSRRSALTAGDRHYQYWPTRRRAAAKLRARPPAVRIPTTATRAASTH